jgi:hypothetical protein
MSQQDQDYYRNIFEARFKDMKRIHNVEIGELPDNLIQLHIMYDSYIREVTIANEVNDYKAYVNLIATAASLAGRWLQTDLSEIRTLATTCMPAFERSFYQLAVDNYGRKTGPPDPTRNIVKITSMVIGSVLVAKLVGRFLGNDVSDLFSIMVKELLITPTVRVSAPTPAPTINIAPVPATSNSGTVNNIATGMAVTNRMAQAFGVN